MRKIIIISIISFLSSTSYSQYLWDFGVHAGASNYLGEIGGKSDTRKDFISDIKLSKTQFTKLLEHNCLCPFNILPREYGLAP